MIIHNTGLVILSGGQDSTTCAAIAIEECNKVEAITFDYGQRHAIEIESAIAVAKYLEIPHEVIKLPATILVGTSPLVSLHPVSEYQSSDELPLGIANTFVPGRNLLFLAIAANRAAAINADAIYIGVNAIDYSGYPDCRSPFIEQAEEAINWALYGTEEGLVIEVPLIALGKAETIALAYPILGEKRFNELFALTHTCYNGIKGGCGKCAACLLRDKGFKDAKIDDPIWKYRTVSLAS